MEKAKTAEEARPIWQEIFYLNNEMYHGGDQLQDEILKAQEIEKLVLRVAEQARREERERHRPLIDEVENAIYRLNVRYGVFPVTVKLLKIALGKAGYEGKEQK